MVKKFKSISKETKEIWEKVAKEYTAYRESGFSANELIEIPAMKRLIGNVKGLRVLDAGCGYGYYSIWAKKKGAKEVVGVDISERMIKMAKEKARREGLEINFIQGDLANLQMFKSGYFGLIMCSIVVSYFGDLVRYFSEFARILKKGGVFVFSEVHPMRSAGYWTKIKGKKVLAVTSYMPAHYEETESDWRSEKGEGITTIGYYHYPLSAFSKALKGTGFAIEEIDEPRPVGKMKQLLPDRYERFARIPLYLLIKARKYQS